MVQDKDLYLRIFGPYTGIGAHAEIYKQQQRHIKIKDNFINIIFRLTGAHVHKLRDIYYSRPANMTFDQAAGLIIANLQKACDFNLFVTMKLILLCHFAIATTSVPK